MKQRRIRKWTNEQLIDAVAKSYNYSQVQIQLGLKIAGGSAATVRYWTEKLKLDTSHFNEEYRKVAGKKLKISDDKIFIINSKVAQPTLRRRAQEIIECKCKICGQLPTHNNLPLVLQLDHVNGNKKDNRLTNLRYLCPNCHTQTPTYGRKHRK